MIPPAVENTCHFTSILSPPRKRNEHAGWFGYPRLWDGSEGTTRTILAPYSETAAVMPPPEIEAMEPRDARLCHLVGRCGRRWQRCRLLPNRGVARPRLAPYCCRRPKGGRLPFLTLTLTSIDITLAINARRRGRRCTVLSFFFRNCGDPFSYLTRVLGFSTTPFFLILPLFSFFFSPPFLYAVLGVPAIFHFGNRWSPP